MSETIQRLPEPTAAHETLEAVAVYLRDEVRSAHAHVQALLKEGRPGYAMFRLRRSLDHQLRIIGRHDIGEVWAAMQRLDRTPGHHAPGEEPAARTWPPAPLVVPGAQLPVRRAGGA